MTSLMGLPFASLISLMVVTGEPSPQSMTALQWLSQLPLTCAITPGKPLALGPDQDSVNGMLLTSTELAAAAAPSGDASDTAAAPLGAAAAASSVDVSSIPFTESW